MLVSQKINIFQTVAYGGDALQLQNNSLQIQQATNLQNAHQLQIQNNVVSNTNNIPVTNKVVVELIHQLKNWQYYMVAMIVIRKQ